MPKKRIENRAKARKTELVEPIWERQNGEPLLWFNRFILFLELGPSRSVLGVYKRLRVPDSGNKEQDKARRRAIKSPPRAWTDKVEFYQWRARAEAYYQIKLAEQHKRWLEEAEKNRQNEYDTGNKLMDRAEAMLKFPLEDVVKKEKIVKDGGKTIIYQTTIIKAARWTMADVPRFAEIGVKLKRQAINSSLASYQYEYEIDEDSKRTSRHSLFPLVESDSQTETTSEDLERSARQKFNKKQENT